MAPTCLCLFMLMSAYNLASTEPTLSKLSTTVGGIVGLKDTYSFDGETFQVRKYLGIPYGAPPISYARFKKPFRKPRFLKEFNATTFGKACIQNTKLMPGLEVIDSGEDCLNLNIFVPDDASPMNKKAVMIFIYGGAFQIGTQHPYAAEALPGLYDVVLVTINYRLNVYGFLASKKHGIKGNFGLWDQHLAIKWVHDNIASFGGDPEKVTLFGESAGSVSAMYQAMYDGNKGLFQRVILQSGVVNAYFSYTTNPEVMFQNTTKTVGCTGDSAALLSCLRKQKNFDRVYTNSMAISEIWLPVQDGDFVKYNPAELFHVLKVESTHALRNFANLDAIIGFNSHEGFLDIQSMGQILNIDITSLANGLNVFDELKYLRYFKFASNLYSSLAVNAAIDQQYTNWKNTSDAFARRDNLLDLMSDFGYQAPAIKLLDALHWNNKEKNSPKKTYMYRFEHRSSFSWTPEWVTGANHADELVYIFAFPQQMTYRAGDPGSIFPRKEIQLSKSMMKLWTQFAKYGNPNGQGNPIEWPVYETRKQEYIIFKTDSNPFPVGNHFRPEYMNFWNRLYPTIVSSVEQNKNVQPKCPSKINKAASIAPEIHNILALVFSTVVVILTAYKV